MKKILIADDEEILRMLIADTIEDLGCEIDVAEDGQQAFDKLMEVDYDLVILDYMMPFMTGVDVLEKLPQKRKENVEILMLTAKTQEADREKMIAAGADYFMPKPFSPIDLISVIEGIM